MEGGKQRRGTEGRKTERKGTEDSPSHTTTTTTTSRHTTTPLHLSTPWAGVQGRGEARRKREETQGPCQGTGSGEGAEDAREGGGAWAVQQRA